MHSFIFCILLVSCIYLIIKYIIKHKHIYRFIQFDILIYNTIYALKMLIPILHEIFCFYIEKKLDT